MKRVTSICIIGSEKICRELLYEPNKDKIPKEFSKYKYNGGQLNLPLEPDSPELKQAIQIAQENNLHPRLFSKVQYTKKEIGEIPFFQMYIPDPLELEGTDASDYGTQYVGGCSTCSLGGRPVGDVLVDRKFVKKYKIGNVRPDIYVSEELKKIIEDNNLTGVGFIGEMKDYKGREMPKYHIMRIGSILPPMSDSTWLNYTGGASYKECGHNVVYLQSDVQYEKEKIENAKDFNLSTEYINNFRLQETIVSARVRKIFKEHKIYSFFFPVAIL